MVDLLPPATGGSVELERPQEVAGVLEVGANSDDFVNQVFDTDDAESAKSLLNDFIGGNRCAVTIDLEKYVIQMSSKFIYETNFK